MSLAAAAVLAKSGEAVKSGPIGLAVILILCIVCYFLFKSMSKHLKTVREDFPANAPAKPAGAPVRQADSDPATGSAQRVADPGQPGVPPPATGDERPAGAQPGDA